MKLTGFFFCGCLFSSVGPPAAAAPTGEPQTGSPVQVSAVAGADGLLPCRRPAPPSGPAPSGPGHAPAGVRTVEWTRVVDGQEPLTVHVVRDGEELVKERAAAYASRTALLEDGSLTLLRLVLRDSGTYRCVQVRGPEREEVFVALTVAQVSPVLLSVRRSPGNRLQLRCSSSGWSPVPLVTLRDAAGLVLPAQTSESSRRPDGLFAVSAVADVTGGSGLLGCRVEIPELLLANQEQLLVTDDFHQDGLGGRLLVVVFVVVFVVCVAFVLFIVPLRTIGKLRSVMQHLTASCVTRTSRTQQRPEERPLLQEYGDIRKVETSGASEDGARANVVNASGVQASYWLAESDLPEMNNYREMIHSVGNALRVSPALIAAIVSRQSRAGTQLSPDGYGEHDRESFGLMQINKRFHAVKGGAYSREHVDQSVTFLVQLIKTMRRTKPGWSPEQQLKGALACYVSGEHRVAPLAYEQLDSVTPLGDFCNDVVARAHWYHDNGF